MSQCGILNVTYCVTENLLEVTDESSDSSHQCLGLRRKYATGVFKIEAKDSRRAETVTGCLCVNKVNYSMNTLRI